MNRNIYPNFPERFQLPKTDTYYWEISSTKLTKIEKWFCIVLLDWIIFKILSNYKLLFYGIVVWDEFVPSAIFVG